MYVNVHFLIAVNCIWWNLHKPNASRGHPYGREAKPLFDANFYLSCSVFTASIRNICSTDAILFLFILFPFMYSIATHTHMRTRTQAHSRRTTDTHTHTFKRHRISNAHQYHKFESCVAVGSAVAFVVSWKHTLLGISRTHTFSFPSYKIEI